MAFDAGLEPSKSLAPQPTYLTMKEFMEKASIKPPSPFVAGCPCGVCSRMRGFAQPSGPVDKKRDLALLKIARARIEKGWTQNALVNSAGVCGVGAIIFALNGKDPYGGPTNKADVDRLARYLPGMGGATDVIRFNNVRGRKKEEVLRMFDIGIARLERGALEPPPYPGNQPLRINSASWIGIDL